MEPEHKDERLFFEKLIESLTGLGYTSAMKYVKGLNLDGLSDKEKADFLDNYIIQVRANIKAIGRGDYCTENRDQLWKLFKSKGYLNNPEEIQKLQEMIIQLEIFKLLIMLELETDNRLAAVREKGKKDLPASIGEVTADQLYEVLSDVQVHFHLVAAPSTLHDFVRIALCHDWYDVKKPIYVGCMTIVLRAVVDCIKRYNPDFNFANIGRCQVFISKAGHPISAQDLRSSPCKNPRTLSLIESCFVLLRKKH